MATGGMTRNLLEARVQELMTLMNPSYLKERSDSAEAMRRLLFAGGIAVATAMGTVTPEAMTELERLLGLGSIPPGMNPEAVLADLPSRIEGVRGSVPPLRRVQVIRDLCLIARADGHMAEAELEVIRQIAAGVEVEPDVVSCALDPSSAECGCTVRSAA